MTDHSYSSRLHRVIPGGAHTYSRGDDQYPINAPEILARGEGAYVWDAQGKKYLDYGMALRAVTVGYADREIADAAYQQILAGNNLTRASMIELEAAELLTALIPGAEMVKFAKNGSTVTSAAIKLARAYTGRQKIAICAQHPFFSYDDWFIGSTIMKRGVPNQISDLTLKFDYNQIASLEALFNSHPGQIAAVMLEPATTVEPQESFLQKVQALCKKHGAVFILDEMITGFRWALEGASKMYGVTPDLLTFGKGMANGFSVAALAGKREIMDIAGITEAGRERVFLASTTHGAEMCGLGAFVKTIQVYRTRKVVEHLWAYGTRLKDGMNGIAKELGIQQQFRVEGVPCSPAFTTYDTSLKPSLGLRTLFLQEMFRHGVMMPWIAVAQAHQAAELDQTLSAVQQSLQVYRRALEDGVEKHLIGRAIKPVFRREN